MRRLVAGLAFLSSVAAFVVIAGGGFLLLLIENSGERGAGALLALSGSIAFAAAMILIFAREGAFTGRGGRAGAVTASVLGALPSAALSAGALRFSGLPLGSDTPFIDWPAFAAGLLLALGAFSLLATGYWRTRERPPPRARSEALRPAPDAIAARAAQPIDTPRQAPFTQPTMAARTVPTRAPVSVDEPDEAVPVTPVDLPSIGQFRRR
ncbi:MAG: hypothetical protein ACRED5_14895 [Propylenella sp.]